jgi:hypothetical protein
MRKTELGCARVEADTDLTFIAEKRLVKQEHVPMRM